MGNYLKWSHFVQTFSKGKGKSGHLTSNPPHTLDPKFAAREEADVVVLSWLWNVMTPKISDAYIFMRQLRRHGIAVKQIIPKLECDAPQINEIKIRISNTKQGNYSISEYAHTLQNLWQELDHYELFEAKCNEDVDLLRRYKEKDRIYQLTVHPSLYKTRGESWTRTNHFI